MEASEAWLERALLRAEPVTLLVRVVEPTVVSDVTLPLIDVETTAEVTVVWGIVVAPGTPLSPEMVVKPVMVETMDPLEMTEVKALVVTAEGVAPASEPVAKIVVSEVDSKVEPPLVIVATTSEVVMGLGVLEPSVPVAEAEAELDPPLARGRLRGAPASAHSWLLQEITVLALESSWQAWIEQSRMP